MDVSDSSHILSDDRIVTAIRAIIRLALVRALDIQQKDRLLTLDEATARFFYRVYNFTCCYKSTILLYKCGAFVTHGAFAMEQTEEDKILALFHSHKVIRSSDLEKYGCSRQALKRLVDKGRVTQIGRGLYRQVDAEVTENSTVVEACKAFPQGVLGIGDVVP